MANGSECKQCPLSHECSLICGGRSCRVARWVCDLPSQKLTNADKIRAMSDRELASFITFQVERKENTHAGKRFNHWFEWLKEEVTDDRT